MQVCKSLRWPFEEEKRPAVGSPGLVGGRVSSGSVPLPEERQCAGTGSQS